MHSRPPARSLNPQGDDPLPQRTDADLLRAWTAAHSEPAFRELVRRHAGLVLATARRRLGADSPLADDAAQQAFIALARKPSRALRSPSLGAWLHRAAAFEAGNLLRGEVRHHARALAATSGIPLADPAGNPAPLPDAWLDALPHLDAALASLPEQDRALLILHHIEGLTYREAADRLGCASAAAAQRRGHRALEKLSTQLRRRGVLVPAATLALGLSPALAPPTASAAMASRAVSAGGAAGSGAGLLAALLTPPALTLAAAVITSAAAFLVVRHFQNRDNPPSPVVALAPPAPRRSPLNRPSPPPRPAQPEFKVQLPDEKLTEDQLTFIAKAKTDAGAAMVWAREKFPASNALWRFLQQAGRALADRDPAAADRVLMAAATPNETDAVFQSVLESKLKRDFPAAIAWADQWNLTHPASPQPPFLAYANWDSGEWRPDLPAALAASRSSPVRNRLIQMECERLTAENEEGLPALAQALTGREQKCVLEYHLSVLLKRGLPGAAELLVSLQPERLHDTKEIALQCPEVVLEYQMSLPKLPNDNAFYSTALDVGVAWLRTDPVAAAAWCAKYTKEELFDHSLWPLPDFLKREGGLQ